MLQCQKLLRVLSFQLIMELLVRDLSLWTLGTLTETVVVSQMAGQLPDEGMESDAMTLAAKMYAGWNLGNTLEAIGGETAWGNPRLRRNLSRV